MSLFFDAWCSEHLLKAIGDRAVHSCLTSPAFLFPFDLFSLSNTLQDFAQITPGQNTAPTSITTHSEMAKVVLGTFFECEVCEDFTEPCYLIQGEHPVCVGCVKTGMIPMFNEAIEQEGKYPAGMILSSWRLRTSSVYLVLTSWSVTSVGKSNT